VNTDIQSAVVAILQSTLGLPDGAIVNSSSTEILGVIPELDSMAVVGVLTTFEEQFGIYVDDEEINGETFATVGSLSAFVLEKLE
jgi:acyl carrier protein